MRLALVACVLLVAGALPRGAARRSVEEMERRMRTILTNKSPPAMERWDGSVEADPLAQVADYLRAQEREPDAFSALQLESGMGAEKVHGFCEICILIMQMKQRGQPHLCAGLNPDYYVTCVENLESILRADKAVTYWLRSGCLHLDREGPEIVKPCPAHAICAWVPNLFADVGIVTPRNELSPLCPKDFAFLPRIPRKPE